MIVNPILIFQAQKVKFEEEKGLNEDSPMTAENSNQIQEREAHEEGQVDELHQPIDSSDTEYLKRVMQIQAKPTNLLTVLSQIERFFNRFAKDPIVFEGKKPTKVQETYPKYLCKYSLFKLQLRDYLFRETFLYQVMVFIECLRKPIKKEQLDTIKVDTLENKCMDYLFSRAQALIAEPGRRGHRSQSLSNNLTKTLQRELIWTRAKSTANTPLTNAERVSQNDLLNFSREIKADHQSTFKRKRDRKAEEKAQQRAVERASRTVFKVG